MGSSSEIGRYRLYPPLTEPSYLVLRSRRQIFTRWFDQFSKSPLRVLDVGGRHQPYRPLLGDRVSRYVAVDVVKTDLVTVMADGQALPFAPESFDLVIATQVFEYFQNPHLAAQQMHAALRPGGMLIGSVAAFAPRFVGPEGWRFFPEGIRSILNPFKSVEIIPEVYSIGGLLRAINVALSVFVRFDSARLIYRWTACPMLNLLGRALESLNLTSSDAFTGNYSIRAVK